MLMEAVNVLQRTIHQLIILIPIPKMRELFEWDEERMSRGSFQSHHETTKFSVVGLKHGQVTPMKRAERHLQTHDKLIMYKNGSFQSHQSS